MDIRALTKAVPIHNELEMPRLQKAQTPAGKSFEDTLGDVVGEVRAQTDAADLRNAHFASATSGALHENMIALEKANVALKMMVSVRNKVVDAYRELSRVQ